MRGFDLLDGGAFFLCTETSPRCFVIQQVNDADGALKGGVPHQPPADHLSASLAPPADDCSGPPVPRTSPGSPSCSPFLPMLPWWFTAECRQQLLNVPSPATEERAPTPDTRPPSSIGPMPLNHEQLRQRIRRQLEYYFSRENLLNDRYLRCQMDADHYVPIKIVANFPKITQLTNDLDLILDSVKDSSQLQVDESGQKVRAVSKRCTIILREIPENADENEVKSMFAGGDCPPYRSLSYGLNDSWYVTFGSEEDTQKAFFHLQTLGKTFNGKPVFARIKTGGAPVGADLHGGQEGAGAQHIQLAGGTLRGQLIIHQQRESPDPLISRNPTPSPGQTTEKKASGEQDAPPAPFDLGQILAQFGYVPRATFKPHHVAAPSHMPPLQPSSAVTVPQPTSYFTQPILHNVGQNEYILRQQAKEGGSRSRDASALIPSPVPRITDVPRMNGKGASPGRGNSVGRARVGRGEEPMVAAGARRAPVQTPPVGGGGFVGFQRQQSVEAYQIALAANGVGRQRREEAAEWRHAGGGEKIGGTGPEKEKQNSTFPMANRTRLSQIGIQDRSSGPAPPRILASSSSQHCSFDSANWRQPPKFCSPSEVTHQSAAVNLNRHRAALEGGERLFPAHQPPLQPISAPIPRAQPLLSLSSTSFSSLGPSFQQQTKNIFGGGGASRGNNYRARTWTNDGAGRNWPRYQQKFDGGRENGKGGGGKGGGGEQQQEERHPKAEGEGGGRSAKRSGTGTGGGEIGEQQQQAKRRAQGGGGQMQQGGGKKGNPNPERERREERTTRQGHGRRATVGEEEKEKGRQQQQKCQSGYNFVDREFPALFGNDSDAGGRRATAGNLGGHRQQQAPESAAAMGSGTVSGNAAIIPFSAVVAGEGRRRATIGGGGGGGRVVEEAEEAGDDGGGREGGGRKGKTEEEEGKAQQHRSGTIGGAGAGEGAVHSYAQMLRRGPQK